MIKPPLQPNLNKPPLFCPKSPLFKAFWGKNPKNFNKPPPKNPQIFINRRRTIGADTVCVLVNVFDILFDEACSAACNYLFDICPLTFSFYILYQDLPRISRQGEGANEEVDDAIPDINAIAQSGERCVGKEKCLLKYLGYVHPE